MEERREWIEDSLESTSDWRLGGRGERKFRALSVGGVRRGEVSRGDGRDGWEGGMEEVPLESKDYFFT